MEYASNLESFSWLVDKKEVVIADAKPKFFSSLECLYVAFSRNHDSFHKPATFRVIPMEVISRTCQTTPKSD